MPNTAGHEIYPANEIYTKPLKFSSCSMDLSMKIPQVNIKKPTSVNFNTCTFLPMS